MPQLTLRREALEDLRQIGRFTEERWGPAQRELYLRFIDAGFVLLASNPRLGQRRDDLKAGYRVHVRGQHMILYRILADAIEIVRVLHRHMDPDLHMDSDPD